MAEGINLGDVVLHFTASMEGIRGALDEVKTTVPAALEQAGSTAGDVGAAVNKIIPSVQTFGKEGAAAARTVGHEFHEAYGTISLTGELFGIQLPRHVRSLLASLPGVSAALSAAFSGVALIFVIEALIKAEEKIKEFTEHAGEVSKAWEAVANSGTESLSKVGDEILQTQIKLDEFNKNHLAALHNELILIDHASLANLRKEFDDLGKQASAAFAKMENYAWVDFLIKGTSPVAAKNAHKELDDFIKQFDDLARAGQKTQSLELIADAIIKVTDRLNKLRQEAAASRLGTNAAEIASEERKLAFYQYLNEEAGKSAILQDNKNKLAKQDASAKILADQAEAQRKLTAEQLANFNQYARMFAARQAMDKELEKQGTDLAKINDFRLKRQLADQERAGIQQLQLLSQQEEAALAVIDAQMKAEEAADQGRLLASKTAFNARQIGAEQYLSQIRGIYSEELLALDKMLQEKERLVILEAQNEAAQRGEILSEADAKELAQFKRLDAQRLALQQQFNNRYAAEEARVASRILQIHRQINNSLRTAAEGMAAAFGEAGAAALASQESFGVALLQGTARVIGQLAHEWAEFFFAMSIADWFWNPAKAAAEFAAGIALEAVGALVSGLASSIGGKGGGGNSSTTGTVQSFQSPQQVAQQPVQTVNVDHFEGGGLVTKRTLAMIGDAGAGSQREAVLPLGNDSRALDEIAGRIMERGGTASGQTMIINVYPKGHLIDMGHVVRDIHQGINSGKYRLTASDSRRVTRRG